MTDDPARAPGAQAAWLRIHKRLLAFAYKKNNDSLEGVQDFVQTAMAELIARHGADVEALGGVAAVVKLGEPLVANARDLHRKSYQVRKGNRSLSDKILRSLADENDPETALAAHQSQEGWERYVAHVEKLCEPYPCAKLLMMAFNRGDDDPAAEARAKGFTQEDINNERKRLKRLRTQAARELGLLTDGDEDDTEDPQ